VADDKRTPELGDGNEGSNGPDRPATEALPELPDFPEPEGDGSEDDFAIPEYTVYEVGEDGRPVVDRAGRDQDTRESDQRVESWVPPDVLPMPDDRPGWTHRYIRVAILGEADARNVSLRFREGWEPVQITDYPELKVMCDPDGRFARNGHVEIGGLVLCRMPVERAKAREKYYQELAARQIESVDRNYMRENDPRMPVLPADRQTAITFGKG
jgi:hypothetical protein